MAAGLSPEVAILFDTQDGTNELTPNPAYNILRPETVESFFYMWRVTGDPMYREWGWKCALHFSCPANCKSARAARALSTW